MTEVAPQLSEEAANWFAAFGHRLRSAREAAGLLQEQVAQRVGFPERSLRRWERGLADPGVEKTMRLATLYGVSVDWLLGRTDVRACVQRGLVMVDERAVATLHRLAATGRRLADVPPHLVRHPGLQYATSVPEQAQFVLPAEAADLEVRVRAVLERLRAGGSALPAPGTRKHGLEGGQGT